MKVTITTDDGEVLHQYKVIESLPTTDDEVDQIDITDSDDFIEMELVESKHWADRSLIESALLAYWKAGRR